MFTWTVIVLLILINALYVAAEFAAVTARRSRIRQLAEEGHPLAQRLAPTLDDARKLDRYIAACQVGITLSSLVLGAYGQATLAGQLTPLFERWGGLQEIAAGSTAAIVVLVGLTAMQMVLGELVPKSLALQYPVQTALYTVLPMRWSLTLFAWFIAVLNGSGLAILKLLGMPQAAHRHIHSPDEIDLLIAESRDGGLLEPDEQRRLHQALRLGQRRVSQLMTPRPHMLAVDIDAPVDDIVQRVIESPYTRLPVYQGGMDNVIGLLHAKDLARHYAEHGRVVSIKEVMRPIASIPEGAEAYQLLDLLRERHAHQAVVMDEFGSVAGLVTLEDVLAEVLGEVGDEFKVGQPRPERLPDGRLRLPGLMRPDQAEPFIGALWQGRANTIGGHVVDALGHLPQAGERVTIDGVEVEIEQVARRAVVSILATPRPRPAPQPKEDKHG